MNKQNFESKDRFPLSTQALTFMQDMIIASAQLALIGGDNYILSGCVTTGNNISDGIIVISGEIMPFKGGTITETITIIEETIPVSANGLTFANARVKRYAKFATGTGANYYPWVNFKSLQTNKQLEEAKATVKYVDDAIAGIQAGSIPIGVIVMWGGEEKDIPSGWTLCDGRQLPDGHRVPDLRGRFVVGYNNADTDYAIGKKGGKKEVALSVEELPSHRHIFTADKFAPGKYSDIEANFPEIVSGVESRKVSAENGGMGHACYTTSAGKGKSFNIRPPYYTLAFIIKINV